MFQILAAPVSLDMEARICGRLCHSRGFVPLYLPLLYMRCDLGRHFLSVIWAPLHVNHDLRVRSWRVTLKITYILGYHNTRKYKIKACRYSTAGYHRGTSQRYRNKWAQGIVRGDWLKQGQ